MPSTPSFRLRPTIAMVAIMMAMGTTLTWATTDDLASLLQRLQAELAAGRHAEALVTARRCADLDPGSAAIQYNLAGLEQAHGDTSRAVAALRRAVALGFDDMRFADSDDDLGDLRDTATYRRLRADWQAGLAARVDGRAMAATAGAWTDPITLADRQGGLAPPMASVRLRVLPDFLEVEMTTDAGDPGPAPPWLGGTGVLISVALREDAAEGDGRRHAELGYGLVDGLPAGAIRLGGRWQGVAELSPKFRRDPDSGHLRVLLNMPWGACGDLHPLVDDSLLVNITLVRGGDPDAGRAALVADPATGRADRPWRRGVPLTVTWPAGGEAAVRAAPRGRVITDGTLALAPLGAVADGDAAVRLAVRDRRGDLAAERRVALPAADGARRTDVSWPLDLPAGSVRLGATLDRADPGPGAAPVTWETRLLWLPDGWAARTADRIAAAPAMEQASLRYRLDAVTAAVAAAHRRDDPSAIGSTVDELETMLEAVEATGTSLPDAGSYLALIPATDDAPAGRCSLALPAGWRDRPDAPLLLLLARAPGAEQRAVTLAPRLLAERGGAGQAPPPVIMAVPHLGPRHDPDAALAMTAAVVDWLRAFTGRGRVLVAGADLLAATALEASLIRPGAIDGVMLLTGMHFAPYTNLEDGRLPSRLAGLNPALPVAWISFPGEQRPGDQADALRAALVAHGLTIAPEVSVAGGLNISQAWSRAMLWAAGLQP
jgi:hypothetical protein